MTKLERVFFSCVAALVVGCGSDAPPLHACTEACLSALPAIMTTSPEGYTGEVYLCGDTLVEARADCLEFCRLQCDTPEGDE
jgi:hypothetical protein